MTRVLPALLAVGLAEATAYRVELLVWVLTSTMPLVMLPLWQAVAETGAVNGYDGGRFVAYFLSAFVVLQLTTTWASWTINMEIKEGSLALRLMRPVHPFWAYATQSLGAIPVRLAVALPLALALLLLSDVRYVLVDPLGWALVPLALAGAWAITFFAHTMIGSLSFWAHSSIRMTDAWNAAFLVLSGYLAPVAIFPSAVRWIPDFLPFRYQLGFPVELLMGTLTRDDAARMLFVQWLFVLGMGVSSLALWRRGLARYAAYGG